MKPLILTFVLSCGADAALTHRGLATGTQRELLLPSQHPYATDAMIAAQAAGGSWALLWLDRHKHPKAARIVGWTLTGLRLGAVAWGLHQL